MQAESHPQTLTNRFLLVNRFVTTSPDGWVLVAPYGEFPHGGGEDRVMQIVDRSAAQRMVMNFRDTRDGGLRLPYFDFDHLGDDPGNKTEAAAWIDDLEARDNGLYAQLRMTDLGEQALSSGRYRYLSPTWRVTAAGSDPGTGTRRVRPVELIGGGFTNQPNLPLPPLSNRESQALPHPPNIQIMTDTLQPIRNRLGLADNASLEDILATLPQQEDVATLRNRAEKAEADLQAITAERDELRNREVDALLAEHSAVIGEDQAQQDYWRGNLLANREATLATLKAIAAKQAAGASGKDALTNRFPGKDPGKPPMSTGQTDAAAAIEREVIALRNRTPGLSYEHAYRQIKAEKPELFQPAN